MNGPNNPIGWCDYTFNPVVGCLRGCEYCYARRLAGRLLKRCPLCATFQPHMHPERLDEPDKVRQGARIFVGSMCDLFGPWVDREWMPRILETVKRNPQHTFLFLTKYPDALKEYNPWPANCGVGVTATDGPTVSLAITRLRKVDARIRFVSIEPLLADTGIFCFGDGVTWVIVGAQTGPNKVVPECEWVTWIVRAAHRTGTPLYLKDNILPYWSGHPIQEFPAEALK